MNLELFPTFILMIRKHIPNIITLCNLALGTLSVIMAFQNQLAFASVLILASAVLDFLDGFTARLLKAYSAIGKQLDSFADLVSFGFAPAAILFKLMEYSLYGDIFSESLQNSGITDRLLLLSPILLVLFSAIRLAEFNAGGESRDFRGMATPATGIFIAGLTLSLIQNPAGRAAGLILNPFIVLGLILALSLLMICGCRMFSLKFSDRGWKGNEIRYFFLAVSCILLIILHEIALPVIILVYLATSIIYSMIRKEQG